MRILPHSVIFLLGALLCAGTAFLGLRRRNQAGGWSFVGVMAAAAVWTGGAAVEAAVVAPACKILWSKIEYIGLSYVSVCLLSFVMAYTQKQSLVGPSLRVVLWLIPTISLALVWTNEWHHLQWSCFSPGSVRANVLVYHRGPIFWFIMGYTYLFAAAAYLLLWRACRLASGTIRRQYRLFMLSGLFPLTTGAIYLVGQEWVRGLDISPLGFSVAGLMIAWNLCQFRLLDLVPVGRTALVENIPDGMVVFDAKGRLADSNPAARRMLGIARSEEDATGVLARYPVLGALLSCQTEATDVVSLMDGALDAEVRLVPLTDACRRLRGRLLILRDVTERQAAVREREKMIGDLQRALAEIKKLSTLLPICCSCKKIRNDGGYWQQLESYISEHAGVAFSHGLCPECEQKIYGTEHSAP